MTTCKSCKAPIFWAVTDDGKNIPMDPDPNPDGNLVVVEEEGGPEVRGAKVTKARTPGLFDRHLPRYMAHWVTCPYADHHRSKPR